MLFPFFGLHHYLDISDLHPICNSVVRVAKEKSAQFLTISFPFYFTALFKKQIEFWFDLYVEHTEPRIAAAGARIKIRELR